jgi:hypothetical protein
LSVAQLDLFVVDFLYEPSALLKIKIGLVWVYLRNRNKIIGLLFGVYLSPVVYPNQRPGRFFWITLRTLNLGQLSSELCFFFKQKIDFWLQFLYSEHA